VSESDEQRPLIAHSWIEPEPDPESETESETDSETESETESEAEFEDVESSEETRNEFERRVNERVRVARYPHSLKRLTYSPRDLTRIKDLDAQAAVWVPVVTFAVTAVCAMIVVILATQVADDSTRGKTADLVVGVVVLVFLGAGFGTLVKSQAYFDRLRPPGRFVRTDLADAYETIRDGAAVFLDLGVVPQALSRIADLLPQSEGLLDVIVDLDARGISIKGHAAYEQLIRMGAEVTVLTDMAEERLGRRSLRRKDRNATADRNEPRLIDETLTPFQTLADLAEMIGIEIPPPRESAERDTESGVYGRPPRNIPKHD
jgi:hypothetical protein